MQSVLSAKNQALFDQQSISSNSKKSSRLSNLNPMRNKTTSKYLQESLTTSPSIITTNTLGSNNSSISNTSTSNVQNDNYQLIRMETNQSIDSNFSLQSQYKVSLNMNKKEIELIRYTWNKMILDEPIVEKKSSLPLPGSFPTSSQKEKNYISKTSASTVASSLFCRQFYSNLLSMNPDLEKLFPSIKHQAVSFAGVLSFAISQLENLSNLDAYLINLGKRHSRILGIEPSNFELMGEALIHTFHERFGIRFNQELEVLWIKLYLYLANSLLQFGIDPILKLNDKEKDYAYGQISSMVIPNKTRSYASSNDLSTSMVNTELDKRSSISTNLTSVNNSTMFDNASAANANANTKRSPQIINKDDHLMKKTNIKKKKRECIIM